MGGDDGVLPVEWMHRHGRLMPMISALGKQDKKPRSIVSLNKGLHDNIALTSQLFLLLHLFIYLCLCVCFLLLFQERRDYCVAQASPN